MIGRLTPTEVLQGIGIQFVWIIVGWQLMHWLWRRGIRRYSAVGA